MSVRLPLHFFSFYQARSGLIPGPSRGEPREYEPRASLEARGSLEPRAPVAPPSPLSSSLPPDPVDVAIMVGRDTYDAQLENDDLWLTPADRRLKALGVAVPGSMAAAAVPGAANSKSGASSNRPKTVKSKDGWETVQAPKPKPAKNAGVPKARLRQRARARVRVGAIGGDAFDVGGVARYKYGTRAFDMRTWGQQPLFGHCRAVDAPASLGR